MIRKVYVRKLKYIDKNADKENIVSNRAMAHRIRRERERSTGRVSFMP